MAKLAESATYEAGIYQIEKTDPVEGGAPEVDVEGDATAGHDNVPNAQLANRTAFLKAAIDALGAVKGKPDAAFSDNMNDLKTAGFHAVASGASNKPTSGAHLVLVLQNAAEDQWSQTAYRLSDGASYNRVHDGTNWLAWKSMATLSDLPDVGTAGTKDVEDDAGTVVETQNLGSAARHDHEEYFSGSLTGAVVAFAMNAPPSGFLAANGAAVSRTTYADLYAAIGDTFGAGDGSTTFNLPNMYDNFIRGWPGSDISRVFGSFQADQFEDHKHLTSLYVRAADEFYNTEGVEDVALTEFSVQQSGSTHTDLQQHYTYPDPVRPTGSPAASAGFETRPRNIALLFCIKY